MQDLIESNEFGDWLMGEISAARAQPKAANLRQAEAAELRMDALQIAKKILLEFLTLQQAMMDAASEARKQRRNAEQSAKLVFLPSRKGGGADASDPTNAPPL